MLRSMTSAISGMRNHQVAMDVVGANIANVNTVGYKAGTMSFKEAIYQTYSKGSQPDTTTNTLGGTNPIQVGLGVTMGGISTNMTQGSVTSTGKNTDLMIQGEGFFMVGKGTSATQASVDYFTRDGSFGTDSEGFLVDPVTGYYLVASDAAPGAPTVGSKIQIPADWKSFSIGADGLITGINASGALVAVDNGGAEVATTAAGALRVGLATFPNPAGLVKAGGSFYEMGSNAGPNPMDATQIGAPAAGARGGLVSGSLESSNVDLAEQFSKMIMAQRGFQANSRVITTSDEMLQELVNLKR